MTEWTPWYNSDEAKSPRGPLNGKTYARSKPLLDRNSRFAGHLLEVRGRFLPDLDIQTTEATLLTDYSAIYGELPPCNSSQPKAAAEQEA